MKTLVVVASGAADRPVDELGGRTPLEAAATPSLDRLVRDGRIGRLVPAPPPLRAEEGAFVLGLFGLDPVSYGDVGATLEAAALGVDVGPGDLALRLSLVTADEKQILDPSAGGIVREEADLLLEALAAEMQDADFTLHAGDGGRGVLVWRGAREVAVRTVPPAEIAGRPFAPALPRGTGTSRLLALIEQSRAVFAEHEVNDLRRELGENPATFVWPWGPGIRVPLPEFTTRTGLEATAVGVEAAFLGAARLQGIPTITPEGATGRATSNLRAKTEAALRALEQDDLVFLHVEGAATAAYAHDFVAKVEILERFDGYVVGLAIRAIEAGLPARLVVIGGPGVATGGGGVLREPVPFVIFGAGVRSHRRGRFTEATALEAGFQVEHAHELLEFLLHLPG